MYRYYQRNICRDLTSYLFCSPEFNPLIETPLDRAYQAIRQDKDLEGYQIHFVSKTIGMFASAKFNICLGVLSLSFSFKFLIVIFMIEVMIYFHALCNTLW